MFALVSNSAGPSERVSTAQGWMYIHISISLAINIMNYDLLNRWWPWQRHQMETFSMLLALCGGNSPVTGEFPSQRPVMLSFDVFFDLRLDKRLSKQSWGWWFETPSHSLWRHHSKWLTRSSKITRQWKRKKANLRKCSPPPWTQVRTGHIYGNDPW